MAKLKCELYNDSMQGWKCYPIQKAQLIIADVPYNVGTNFYGSTADGYNTIIERKERGIMAKLYEIVGELQDFVSMNEGLEDEQAYKDTLEALQGELDDKVSQWARCIKNMEAERNAVKEEADRLAKRAKTIDNQVAHMKDTLLMFLKAAGRDKAGDAVIKASIAKNGGKAPLIVDYINAEDLPQEFQKVTISANNDAIREALENGEQLEWARIGERGEHINIK